MYVFRLSFTNPSSSYIQLSTPDTDAGLSRQASYDKLEVWLRTHAISLGDKPHTCVTLGPKDNYFASSPAGGVISNDLPSNFEHFLNPQ
jgi:hypothetical protein